MDLSAAINTVVVECLAHVPRKVRIELYHRMLVCEKQLHVISAQAQDVEFQTALENGHERADAKSRRDGNVFRESNGQSIALRKVRCNEDRHAEAPRLPPGHVGWELASSFEHLPHYGWPDPTFR